MDVVLLQRQERQRRLKLLSQSISMLDVLVEQLQESNEHYLMSLDHDRLFDYHIEDRFTVDIIVMFQNHEVFLLEVDLGVHDVDVEGIGVHCNCRLLTHTVAYPCIFALHYHGFP